jgi:hypothetical protein
MLFGGKYCFLIIQVAWDNLVISCWFWQLGNGKLVLSALRIKWSYQKCDWREMVKKNQEKVLKTKYRMIK